MKKTVNIGFSEQSLLLLTNMPNINEEQIIAWRCSKDFNLGTIDVLEYLEHLKGD